MLSVLCTIEQGSPAFEAGRTAVDVVCAGDSLTGWNNYGPVWGWPFPTYPRFLQELCEPLGLRVANGGIAGDISDNGPRQVRDYLNLFPNARYFIFGMGTNDLGMWPDAPSTSCRIIGNLEQMTRAVCARSKQPILFNVPHANESLFPPEIAGELRAERDYHNPRLKAFCDQHGVPLVDICSQLGDQHFGDHLHPNAEGAKIIAQEIYQALQGLVAHQSLLARIWPTGSGPG